VAAPSQRSALGVLFLVLTALFVGIAVASGQAARDRPLLWVIAAASVALALWLGSLAVRALRAR
jgi:predicted branched-subunit amino acid permease